MTKYWCHNAKTGEIFSYNVTDCRTDFPKGTLLVCGDHLTTGFKSKEDAQKWSMKYGCCDRCKTSLAPDEKGECRVCGSSMRFNGIKEKIRRK